jgi:hypothetical protein
MDLGLKTIVWWDRSMKTWCAVYQDSNCDQVGDAGYGTSKKEAIADVAYQFKINQKKFYDRMD